MKAQLIRLSSEMSYITVCCNKCCFKQKPEADGSSCVGKPKTCLDLAAVNPTIGKEESWDCASPYERLDSRDLKVLLLPALIKMEEEASMGAVCSSRLQSVCKELNMWSCLTCFTVRQWSFSQSSHKQIRSSHLLRLVFNGDPQLSGFTPEACL